MLRARLTRADRVALAVLVLIPVVVNLPWALAGHPVLDGDNLTQNYPLRVLAGQLLAHGRLPLWDAGIWSGVPLLAGWNAGAMFPGTLLFALLPPVAAYELNVVLTGIACGVGCHLFLRRSGCSPLASVLGAVTWSEMGFVSGQVVHLGLEQGTALVPFLLLALDGMVRAARARVAATHWIGLFGVAGGLVVLAGDPRAISNDAIIAGIYLAARCRHGGGTVWRVLRDAVAGGVLAVVAGAVQWLPGLSYLHSSQRSVSSLALFGYYSLGWGNLPLLALPYLGGGNGNFAMPSYSGPLNLPEVTFAVGILPLVAFFALLPELLGRRRRRRPPASSSGLGVWYVMVLVGAVLTTGAKTPLGHLLVHIPLYGGQRDQNRNAAVADFGLAVLLAIFVDRLRPVPADGVATDGGISDRRARLLGLVPVAVVIGLVGAMYLLTGPMERLLGVHPFNGRLPAQMTPYYVVAVLIALGGALVLLRRRWRSSDGRRRAAAGVVVADTLLFLAMASYQPVPVSVLASSNPDLTTVLAALPAGSRIAIDDPNQLALSSPAFLTDRIGVNDLVLLHDLTSVQGYGSAVPADYDAATGTHDVENLLPSALLGPTFDELDLGLILAVPEQFGTILGRSAPLPLPPGPPVALGTSPADRQPGDVARFPYPPAGPWRLGARPTSWQLPAPADISSVIIAFEAAYGPVPTEVTIRLQLAGGGSLRVTGRTAGTRCSVSVPAAAVRAGGGVLSLSVAAGATAGAPAATGGAVVGAVVGAVAVEAETAGTSLAMQQPAHGVVRYVLNGHLQQLLTPPHWTYAGRLGPLVMYRNTQRRGQAWLEAPGATSASGRSPPGSVTTPSVQPWQDAVTNVDLPSPALLVRSEQYAPGWSVTLQRVGPPGEPGAAVHLTVRRLGLLQAVEISAGRYVVTWHYHSWRAVVGLVLSLAGAVACLALAVFGLLRRRSRLRAAEQ